jgi:hypothetical protein
MSGTRRTTSKPVQMNVSENDIHFIKNMLQDMSNRLLGVETSLVKLNHTVIGDEDYGQKGLVKQVKDHSDYIENDKAYKNKVVGGGVVIAVIYGFILKAWDKIF